MKLEKYEETTKELATHVQIGKNAIQEYDGTYLDKTHLAEDMFNSIEALEKVGIKITCKFLRKAADPVVVVRVKAVDYDCESDNGSMYKSNWRLITEHNEVVEPGDYLILLTPQIRDCLEKAEILKAPTKRGKDEDK